MSFFDNIGRAIENFEERQVLRQEERMMFDDMILADEMWEMEGTCYDPFLHGDMFFDPYLGHHGLMYNGMWHPLDYVNGNWMFVHPSRFNVPRNYQPQNLQPPQFQQAGYPQQGGYGQQPVQGGYQQQGGYNQMTPQAGGGACPRCHAMNAAGSRFCASCGNDLSAQSAASATAHCTNCGAVLSPGARFCASCGHARS